MDSLNGHYELALEALEELAAELVTSDSSQATPIQTHLKPASVKLEQVLDDFNPLPREAIFLGAAYDELPILLNLNDPTPGPVLIAGDAGSGKTAFLQMIAKAVSLIHQPKDVQFGVVTNYPDEWQGFEELPHCVGIFSTYQKTSAEFILSLAVWAHNNHNEKRSALLLIDDLESMSHADAEARQNLRWLLLRGPNRHIWPIATLNAERAEKMLPWLDAFRTRLFGQIRKPIDAESIVPARDAALHLLEPGLEFKLREGQNWVQFWIPSI